MTNLFLIGLLLALLAIHVPVAVAFGLAAVFFLAIATEVPLTLIPQQMFGGTDSTVLQGVPFFILAGAVMDRGGISQRLIALANVLVGWVTGGLAMASVLASMFFAGVLDAALNDLLQALPPLMS